VNAHLTVGTLAVRLVTNPIGQFWFLPVLFLMNVIAVAVGQRRLPMMSVALYCLAFVPPVYDHIGLVGRSVCRYMAFFALGTTRWRPTSRWWALGLVAVWLCRSWQQATVWFPITAFCGSFATIIRSDVLDSGVLRQLGRWSLVIFLAHVLVAAAARAVLLRVGLQRWGAPRDPRDEPPGWPGPRCSRGSATAGTAKRCSRRRRTARNESR